MSTSLRDLVGPKDERIDTENPNLESSLEEWLYVPGGEYSLVSQTP